MKVHLIKKQSVEEYAKANPQSKAALTTWLSIIKRADWRRPGDIVKTFNSSDILGKGSERVVFNIGGNKYRMICKYHFGETRIHLFVKWIGTHSEYSKLCNDGMQFIADKY